MLILFLNNLYKKPIEYQLLWIYILGQIDDGNTSTIQLKKLKKQFNYNKSTFYRILRFGLGYFNNDSNGISIELTKQNIIINVIRNNKAKTIKKSLKSINEKTIKTVDKKTIKTQLEKNTELIKKVINYLNEKTNKKFTIKNKQTIRFINGRVKDGYNENDFIKVIDIKTEKWLNTSMEDYLRPQTLFSQKMESYLNEKNNKKKHNDRFQKTQSAVDKAKQIDWFSKS